MTDQGHMDGPKGHRGPGSFKGKFGAKGFGTGSTGFDDVGSGGFV